MSTKATIENLRTTINRQLAFHFPDDEQASDTRPITLETRRMSRDDSLLAALNQEPLRASSLDELKPVMLSLGVDLSLPINDFYVKLLENNNPHGYSLWDGYLKLMEASLRIPHFADNFKQSEVRFIGPTQMLLDSGLRFVGFLGSPSDLSNYRPVVGHPIHARILERLVKRRLNDLTRDIFGFENKRFGFMANWTVFEAIKQVKDAILADSRFLLVQLAIKSPLSNAWWPAILRIMIELGLPKNLILIIKSYFDKRILSTQWTMTMKNNPNERETVKGEKQMTKGFPAGSVLAPVMWNLLLWDLISKFQKANPTQSQLISYGDELYLVVSAPMKRSKKKKKSMNLQQLTQQSIDFVQKWCLNNKMELDSDATKLFDQQQESNINLTITNAMSEVNQIKSVKNIDIFGLDAQTVIHKDEEFWKRKLNYRFAIMQAKFNVYVKAIQQNQ